MKLKRYFFYFIALLFGILLSGVVPSFAGTTGKISGVIKDKKSGEAIIGASVFLEHKNMGAPTDINGYYSILNIPPGRYTMIISAIGYKRVKISEVDVIADKTTTIDVSVEEEAVQLGEEVIVTAQKKVIQKDITSSELSVSSAEIKNLPVENLTDILQTKAGVVIDASGGIHIRGGRSSEVGYLIDGIPVADKYSSSQTSSVDVQFMEEVKVISGVFNAEYGQAMSGIVEIITKQGDNNFHGNLNISSGDYLSGAKDLYLNINKVNPFGTYDIKGYFTGPIPVGDKNIYYNAAVRRYFHEGWLSGERRFVPTDSSYQAGTIFYINESGDNEIKSLNSSINTNFQIKLSYDPFESVKFSNLFLYDQNQNKYYNHLYKYNPDGIPTYYNTSFNNIFTLTYILSTNTFLTIKHAFNSSENKSYVYENINDPHYANPELLRQLTAFSFLSGGTDMSHNERKTTINTLKVDLLSQVDRYNEVKTGFEFNQSIIKLNNRTAKYQDTIKIFDFNRFLNEGNFTYKPIYFAYYIQDKIEFESIILNAGVRYDYFNSYGKLPVDYRNPETSRKVKAGIQQQISPRLGIAFPISADGTVHFSYGHFFQIPPLEYLYANPNYRVGPGGLYTLMGNANLKAQSTVGYEVGLHYQLFELYGLEITGFYKDISNLLGTEVKDTDVRTDRYALYANRDYGRAKGFTLSFFKKTGVDDNISFSLDYTLQIAEGNASDPNDAFNRAQSNPPKKTNLQVIPLNWDQTHTINFSFFYIQPGDFNIGLIAKFESGFPFTPQYQSLETSLENSARMPSKVNVDLQVNKDFSVFGANFSLYARVFNLLDQRNEINVYNDTGRAGYSLVSQYNQETQGPNTLSEFLKRPDYYSEPRRFLIGINYNFNF